MLAADDAAGGSGDAPPPSTPSPSAPSPSTPPPSTPSPSPSSPSVAAAKPVEKKEKEKERRWWKWGKKSERKTTATIAERINETIKNSLAASKQILDLCQEMNELGLELNKELEVHLERLDTIERMMERINVSMHEAEEDLESLEKCCGLFTLPWKRVPDYEETEDYKETWLKPEDPVEFGNIVGPPDFISNVACKHPGLSPKGPFFDSIIPTDPREIQIEENLQESSKILIAIRRKVVDVAAELELQERYMPIVVEKAISLEHRVKHDTERAHVILKSEGDS